MTDEEEFLAWKAERDEQHRKSGDYWTTPEGRGYIREIYTDYLDGNAVLPLLDALERAEQRVHALEDRLFALGAMIESPCFCCGYNGTGYFEPSMHPCAERHHRLFKYEQDT